MKWSPQQDNALKSVSNWLRTKSSPIFRLFGYAGTGKTTLARHLASGVNGDVVFGAFTGKAAHVLRQKGCSDASTLHSLIYKLCSDEEDTNPTFVLNSESVVANADLIIIDECSMVGEDIGNDLLSFGTPILVLGDPAQLPPVSSGGFFTSDEPDVMLTDIHRQAEDNPIIRMSMIVREGEYLESGVYGNSAVISKNHINKDIVLSTDQVLVGMNKTRHLYNQRIRALIGLKGNTPTIDDKLVCLRNNKKKGLLNGSLWNVRRLHPRKVNSDFREFDIQSEDDPSSSGMIPVRVHPDQFAGSDEYQISSDIRRKTDSFDYGYSLTVHKSQGSQWDNVVLFDESDIFKENKRKWLYTGITRASESIIIVR